MALLELDRDPPRAKLRTFACIWLPLFLGVVAWIVGTGYAYFGAGAALSIVVGAAYPPAVKPVFLGLAYATYPIGFVVSHVLMLVLYYLVMAPIGLLLRAFGHDPLARRIDRDADTYWTKREPADDVTRYFKQF